MFQFNPDRDLDTWLEHKLNGDDPDFGYGLDWEPVTDDDDGGQVQTLVRLAQEQGMITSDNGEGEIWFVLDNDSDGGAYLWLVDVKKDNFRTPRLCSNYTEMRKLVSPSDLFGVAAGRSILEEAVQEANRLLADFYEFTGGTTYVLHGVAHRDPTEFVCMFFDSTEARDAWREELPGRYQELTLTGVNYDRIETV